MSVVGVLDYDMGNLRSVTKALEHVGGTPRVIDSANSLGDVERLVVPGVGAFGACMTALADLGLDGVIRTWVSQNRPLLAVCLGMQVLYEWSEESDVEGLGILPGKVRRLPATVKVPHMGWNELVRKRAHPLLRRVPDGTRLYFVHSYFCDAQEDDVVGVSDHGLVFPAVVGRGAVFATQFHPEKSGPPGLEIYRAFVEWTP
ncbi:MAG: imidazole glycerol phosphate synthase subunit HisH [Actinobacteria bacterium]|nr:imidazole glycerol phosphate synthase subunit HisH [Actinomycetota bacterium]